MEFGADVESLYRILQRGGHMIRIQAVVVFVDLLGHKKTLTEG
jgi:hypothetical protein